MITVATVRRALTRSGTQIKSGIENGEDMFIRQILTIESLDLHGFDLNSIFGIDICSSLKSIDFSMNNIVKIDVNCLCLIMNLNEVDFSSNRIEELSNDVPYLAALRYLNIAKNPIFTTENSIRKSFSNLPSKTQVLFIDAIQYAQLKLFGSDSLALLLAQRRPNLKIQISITQYTKENNSKSEDIISNDKNNSGHPEQDLLVIECIFPNEAIAAEKSITDELAKRSTLGKLHLRGGVTLDDMIPEVATLAKAEAEVTDESVKTTDIDDESDSIQNISQDSEKQDYAVVKPLPLSRNSGRTNVGNNNFLPYKVTNANADSFNKSNNCTGSKAKPPTLQKEKKFILDEKKYSPAVIDHLVNEEMAKLSIEVEESNRHSKNNIKQPNTKQIAIINNEIKRISTIHRIDSALIRPNSSSSSSSSFLSSINNPFTENSKDPLSIDILLKSRDLLLSSQQRKRILSAESKKCDTMSLKLLFPAQSQRSQSETQLNNKRTAQQKILPSQSQISARRSISITSPSATNRLSPAAKSSKTITVNSQAKTNNFISSNNTPITSFSKLSPIKNTTSSLANNAKTSENRESKTNLNNFQVSKDANRLTYASDCKKTITIDRIAPESLPKPKSDKLNTKIEKELLMQKALEQNEEINRKAVSKLSFYVTDIMNKLDQKTNELAIQSKIREEHALHEQLLSTKSKDHNELLFSVHQAAETDDTRISDVNTERSPNISEINNNDNSGIVASKTDIDSEEQIDSTEMQKSVIRIKNEKIEPLIKQQSPEISRDHSIAATTIGTSLIFTPVKAKADLGISPRSVGKDLIAAKKTSSTIGSLKRPLKQQQKLVSDSDNIDSSATDDDLETESLNKAADNLLNKYSAFDGIKFMGLIGATDADLLGIQNSYLQTTSSASISKQITDMGLNSDSSNYNAPNYTQPNAYHGATMESEEDGEANINDLYSGNIGGVDEFMF